MKKINTILFDFDGTIMNTNDIIIKSWQHTFLTVEGKERTLSEIVQTFGEPLHLTMERLLPQIPVDEGVEIYRSFHRDHFHDLIQVFPGVLETLEELQSSGYKIGLVTSRLWSSTSIGLDKYDMKKYFSAIVTHDDTDKHKPDPEPVNIALSKLDSKAQEAIMVGDTMFDILCAKNAGTKAALVGWAMAVSESEKKGENAPDYILEKVEDIFHIIA
ncbi:MAG: pyrophosphatase PpaX [Anaerovoracaceae bacterium]|jgi:pyrophosphatase PpaX